MSYHYYKRIFIKKKKKKKKKKKNKLQEICYTWLFFIPNKLLTIHKIRAQKHIMHSHSLSTTNQINLSLLDSTTSQLPLHKSTQPNNLFLCFLNTHYSFCR